MKVRNSLKSAKLRDKNKGEFQARYGFSLTFLPFVLRATTAALQQFPLLNASIDGNAALLSIKMRPGASACVIAASGGYPGKYQSGLPIEGLTTPADPSVVVFHSGTALKDGRLLTAGGRVLTITAHADNLRNSLEKAYNQLQKISFENMQYRRDIGHRALRN